MNRKDAIRENEPYILVEGPGWGKVEFFGKWLVAAAKAAALWNKAFQDRIFEQQVALLTAACVPIFDMAAMSFVLVLQKNHISFMVPLNRELSEELHEVEALAMMIEMGFFVRTGQHYQMAIPVNLNIKTVKMAALKFAKTADEESLHLDTLVATIPYAEAKAWQSRQRKLDEDRFCAFLQSLDETPESIDIQTNAN